MKGLLTLAVVAVVLGGVYGYLFVPSASGYGYPRPSTGPSVWYLGGPGIFYGPRSGGVGGPGSRGGVGSPSTRGGSLGGPGYGGGLGGSGYGGGFGGGK